MTPLARRFAVTWAAGVLAVAGAGVIHVRVLDRLRAAPEAEMEQSLARVQRELHHLVIDAQDTAGAAARDDAAPAALAGGDAPRAALFRRLERVVSAHPTPFALAVRGIDGAPVAWAGRVSILPDLPAPAGPEAFVLHGAVTSTLVARVPILAPDGRGVGQATAERTLAVRRHIRNPYISDFDLLAREPSVEVLYVDVHQPAVAALPPSDGPHRDAVLSSPQGRALAVVRVTPAAADARRDTVARRYRASVSALALLSLAAVAAAAVRRRSALGVSCLVLLAMRGVVALLGWPWAADGAGLLSAEWFASTLLPLGLLRSPLDLMATAATGFAAAAWVASALAARRTPGADWRRWALAVGLAPLPAVAAFVVLVDIVRNSTLDVQAIRIWPESAAHLLVHGSLLLVLLAATVLVAAGAAWAGPARRPIPAVLAAGALAGVMTWAALRVVLPEAPLAPAAVLAAFAVLLGAFASSRRERLRQDGLPGAAALVLVATAVVAGLLHAGVRQVSVATVRQQIQSAHAPAVLRQPSWRRYALDETRRRLDEMRVLEETLPAASSAGLEELAFALWSSTDLAAFGFSSAVEVQDATGAVASRFALNLPSLSGPERPLPTSAEWEVRRETLRLGSAERTTLHARKLLIYHGEVHGALHVYVAEDYWNLPFLIGRDPYSVLFRTASHAAGAEPTVHLVAWRGNEVVFSSLERPPTPPHPVSPAQWSRLTLDEVPHEAWFFEDDGTRYALLHPALGPGRYLADLVEAVVALTLLAAAALVLAVLALGALGRPDLSLRSVVAAVQRRFALRLFVAFTLVAVLPVAVLQVVLRGFVVDRLRLEGREQALERAAVARKVVQDYAMARQADESPVTDAALVLVSSFVQNDLDLFQDGRLLASSKRELYASGLLPERAPGSVHRALVLENQPWVLGTETIGTFSYLVASVPVAIDARTTGVLSIPLPLPQRELEATVQDLSRTLRLASVVFLALAAALAHGLARRISGPIQDLTAATRRVAQGDLDARVTPHSRDELRDLVEAFNTMAGDLDRQRQDLERSNRLAAWAEMARQVAHEVKNPLTPIQLSAEHLRRVWGAGGADFGATLEICTQTILKQVRTLRGMVTEFSAFARPPAPVLERLDVPTLLREVARPYEAALPEGVTLRLVLGQDIPPVRADRRLLERAIVNLVENALQAIAGAGAVEVGVATAPGEVEIVVSDDGPGIDPEVRARIFEPFFSTKMGGSGLGLALVKKIAEDHGGGVRLDSRPGNTRITVRLPAAEA